MPLAMIRIWFLKMSIQAMRVQMQGLSALFLTVADSRTPVFAQVPSLAISGQKHPPPAHTHHRSQGEYKVQISRVICPSVPVMLAAE